MYKLVLHKNTAKKIEKLPVDLHIRISKAIDLLALNPFVGKKLQGELNGSRRIRVGDFRIIYDIDEKSKVIVVHAIASRGDVYK